MACAYLVMRSIWVRCGLCRDRRGWRRETLPGIIQARNAVTPVLYPEPLMRRLRTLIFTLVLLGLAPVARSQAPAPAPAIVSARIEDVDTGALIPRAEVRVGGVSLGAADGTLPPTTVLLQNAVEDVDVTVSAVGYLPWTFIGLTLRADQPVELRVRLRRAGSTPLSGAEDAPAPRPASAPGTAADLALGLAPPPEYIDIGRTRDLTGTKNCVLPSTLVDIPVERMRFVDYVRNVLPNEWIASWPAASLEAGAVAVKHYAWYNAFVRPKWRSQGYPFDLLDSTCDQVYTPGSADYRTDAAVERTWSTVLTRDGKLFPLYYRAQDYQCGTIADCMSQWGSRDLALIGASSADILLFYYAPVELVNMPSEPAPPCGSMEARAAAPADPVLPRTDHLTRVYIPIVRTC